jgi:AcrR family transcriptional regulator
VTATRRSGTERRAEVVAAAIAVFAEHGCSAPTSLIARRAGLSEAYLYRLFGAKRELLLACHEAVDRRVRWVLEEAARADGTGPRELLRAYGAELTADERRVQLHLQAAATDPLLRTAVRTRQLALLERVSVLIGPSAARALLGHLMAMNLADVLDPPHADRSHR